PAGGGFGGQHLRHRRRRPLRFPLPLRRLAVNRSVSAILAALALAACSHKDSLPPPVIDDFHASAGTISAGGSTWLYFKVRGAASLRIDPDFGDVSGQTSMSAGPAVTTEYTLTATNAGGSVKTTTTLTVIPRPAKLTSFSATPDSVAAGRPVTLKWTAVDAVSLVLSASPS